MVTTAIGQTQTVAGKTAPPERDGLANEAVASPLQGEKTPSQFLGCRLSAMLEIGLFFFIALLVDHSILDGTRYWSISPHPFWLIVILMSTQYGTNEGLLASGVATATLLIGNLPQQSLSQDSYDYLFEVARRPLLWFGAGVVLGELRLRQRRLSDELRRKLVTARHREREIASAFNRVQRVKKDLETKVAGQLHTVIGLYRAAKQLEALEPHEVLSAVVQVVKTLMDPGKFSLFLLKDDRLELAIQRDWSPDDKLSQRFPAQSSLFRSVVTEQRFLCVANDVDERILSREGVLAGPLIQQETGQVLGMLKVEKLGFLDLNLNSVQTFKVLCEWIAVAYNNAIRYQTASSDSVLNQETELYSYGFFARQKKYLVSLAERLGFDLSMIVVGLENEGELSREDLKQAPVLLNSAAKGVLRSTDLTFDYQRTGYRFAILLAGTSLENLPLVVGKITSGLESELEAAGSKARFSFSTQALNQETHERKLLTRELFSMRLRFVLELMCRVPLKVAVLALELAEVEQQEADEANRSCQILRQVVEGFLQCSDTLFGYQYSARVITLVLPAASLREARRIGDGLRATLEGELSQFRTRLSFKVRELKARGRKERACAG
ncbi:MAG: GAF domain-containing protein [Acidobacteriota bacterium]